MSFVRHLKGRYPVSTMIVAPQKIANLIKFNRNSKSLATWFSFLLSQGPLRNHLFGNLPLHISSQDTLAAYEQDTFAHIKVNTMRETESDGVASGEWLGGRQVGQERSEPFLQ